MIITALNGQYYVDIGSYKIWRSLQSTVEVRISKDKKYQPAFDFLQSGACKAENGLITARAMNLVRDALSSVSPEKIVYDSADLSKEVPWNISPVITSGANYFTTADGKDLLAEIVIILTYAYYAKTDVQIQ